MLMPKRVKWRKQMRGRMRGKAMRGAEIFIHPSSEVGSPSVAPKELGRRARAAENIAYVVSANSAALTHIPIPAESTTGMSKVVDYHGQILAEAAPGGESMVAYATIDLPALRACRRGTATPQPGPAPQHCRQNRRWSGQRPASCPPRGLRSSRCPGHRQHRRPRSRQPRRR